MQDSGKLRLPEGQGARAMAGTNKSHNTLLLRINQWYQHEKLHLFYSFNGDPWPVSGVGNKNSERSLPASLPTSHSMPLYDPNHFCFDTLYSSQVYLCIQEDYHCIDLLYIQCYYFVHVKKTRLAFPTNWNELKCYYHYINQDLMSFAE